MASTYLTEPSLIFPFYGRESTPFWKAGSTIGLERQSLEDRRPPLTGQHQPPVGCMWQGSTDLPWEKGHSVLCLLACFTIIYSAYRYLTGFRTLGSMALSVFLSLWSQRILHSNNTGLKKQLFFQNFLKENPWHFIMTSHVLRKGFQKQKIIGGALKLFKLCFSVGRCLPPHSPQDLAEYFRVFLLVYQAMLN